jgi:hypothetical protein
VNVIVEDDNDNAPVFEHSSYEGHIEENSPVGAEVMLNYLIHATDADVGNHAQFTFTLHGDGSELFIVDQGSGRVFVKGLPLDREDKSLYLLRVVARDKGNIHMHLKSHELLLGCRTHVVELISMKLNTLSCCNMDWFSFQLTINRPI